MSLMRRVRTMQRIMQCQYDTVYRNKPKDFLGKLLGFIGDC